MPMIVLMEVEYNGGRSGGVVPQPMFEARWLEEEQCEEVVKNAWSLAMLSTDTMVAEAIRHGGVELHSWSREVLGDRKNRIKKAKKDLNRCRKGAITQQHISMQQLLQYKHERPQDQKNLY